MAGDRARAWRWVGWSMGAGAAYDLAFAVAILGFSGPASRLMGLEVPADPTYLRLNGVFLLMLGALYILAARQPERYMAIVVLAAAGRTLGFLLFASSWLEGGPPVYLVLGCLDLVIGAVHALLLVTARRRSA